MEPPGHESRPRPACAADGRAVTYPARALLPLAPGIHRLRAGPRPDRSVVPAVWARYTDLLIDRGEGSWLVTTDGERYLDYTSGHRRDQHRPCPSAGRGGRRGAGREAAPRPAEHRLPRGRPAAARPPRRDDARAPAGAPSCANSGAEAVEAAVKLARVATGRPSILAFRGGFHGRTAQTMALTSSRVTIRGDFEPLPGSVYHAAYPVLLPRAGGPHDPSACTCDWESAAGDAVRADGRPGEGRGDDHRAGHRRGRLHRAAARASCRGCARSRPARHPAHRRRGPDGLRPDRAASGPWSTGTWGPTSW